MSHHEMPPLPYSRARSRHRCEECSEHFTDPSVWDSFDPKLMTLCSPDPQPSSADQEGNVLPVGCDEFQGGTLRVRCAHAILRGLAQDIEAPGSTRTARRSSCREVRCTTPSSSAAKWAMLLAGNYRCVQAMGCLHTEAVQRYRGVARGLTSGSWTCACRWVPALTTWCLREVRKRGAIAAKPLVRRARARFGRTQHRARRPPRADRRRPARQALGRRRPDRRPRRQLAREEPPQRLKKGSNYFSSRKGDRSVLIRASEGAAFIGGSGAAARISARVAVVAKRRTIMTATKSASLRPWHVLALRRCGLRLVPRLDGSAMNAAPSLARPTQSVPFSGRKVI